MEPTSTGIMRNYGRDPCEVRTHNPKVARQTPYLLDLRSSYFKLDFNTFFVTF